MLESDEKLIVSATTGISAGTVLAVLMQIKKSHPVPESRGWLGATGRRSPRQIEVQSLS
jgi:hypothetical protein